MPKPGVVLSLCMCWGPTGCSWPCLRREHEAGGTVGRCSYKVCYSICSSPMDLQLVSCCTNSPSSMKAAFCTCFCALMRTICQDTPQIPCWHGDPLWCWSGSFSAIAPRLYVDRELWSLYLQTWACRGKTWILHDIVDGTSCIFMLSTNLVMIFNMTFRIPTSMRAMLNTQTFIKSSLPRPGFCPASVQRRPGVREAQFQHILQLMWFGSSL